MQGAAIDRLNDRERQCLRLVGQGYSTKDIARILDIKDHRASKIIGSALRKLGTSRRIEAARLLAEHENRGVNVIPGAPPTLSPTAPADPFVLRDEQGRVANRVAEERVPYGEALRPHDLGVPLRPRGGRLNDLGTWQRITWMTLLWAVALLGIGSFATQLGKFSNQIIVVPAEGR
jgi:DNA-binding CsgD family transcriptional regulator